MSLIRISRSIFKKGFIAQTLRPYRIFTMLRRRRFSWRLASVATLCGYFSIRTVYTEDQGSELLDEDLERIVKKADQLFDNNEFEKLLEFLSAYKEYNEPKLLWRLSRANYKVALAKSTTKERSKELAYKAVELVEKSLELDSNSFAAHKWAGITLSHINKYEGFKSQIKQAHQIKSYFDKSLKLHPNEPTTLHLLGQWCYSIADISWIERRIIATILATPPDSSFEEALECFKKAEDQQPGFYSMNWLFLAKTLIKMNRLSEAKHWLDKLSNYRIENEEDENAVEEGKQLKKVI
ncbi:Regulator of microtubule dynamics protein 1 [Oopsacas minuta]|uniref:Regulator of microtubule dynamics protein 1 n=1 Tax=Oopsacas minuta TaxID=111878 RepID=A0AAV7JY97_9METZ|nr:Regulator of microtubule dynamics protein 1 [Oopsacas minuta]